MKLVRSDDIPVRILKTWPLAGSMFDGEVAAGLVPVLFGQDPKSSLLALNKDLPKAHKDMMAINRRFSAWESINVKDSIALIKKPR